MNHAEHHWGSPSLVSRLSLLLSSRAPPIRLSSPHTAGRFRAGSWRCLASENPRSVRNGSPHRLCSQETQSRYQAPHQSNGGRRKPLLQNTLHHFAPNHDRVAREVVCRTFAAHVAPYGFCLMALRERRSRRQSDLSLGRFGRFCRLPQHIGRCGYRIFSRRPMLPHRSSSGPSRIFGPLYHSLSGLGLRACPGRKSCDYRNVPRQKAAADSARQRKDSHRRRSRPRSVDYNRQRRATTEAARREQQSSQRTKPRTQPKQSGKQSIVPRDVGLRLTALGGASRPFELSSSFDFAAKPIAPPRPNRSRQPTSPPTPRSSHHQVDRPTNMQPAAPTVPPLSVQNRSPAPCVAWGAVLLISAVAPTLAGCSQSTGSGGKSAATSSASAESEVPQPTAEQIASLRARYVPRPAIVPAERPAKQPLGLREWTLRETAADALARIGPPAVPALVDALHDPDADTRAQAARALARMGRVARDALPALVEALNDPDPRVRHHAARALGQMGPDAAPAIPALVRVLHQGDADSSAAGSTATGNGPPRHTPTSDNRPAAR